MPRQRLELLADGRGLWAGLAPSVRRAQLDHMTRLIEELYPGFRLFLYDQRRSYSIPYTVFGPQRAAIFVGEMYVVLNSVEHIRALSRHFDNLIRHAEIAANDTAAFVRSLKVH
jgi:hypothetical protein